MLDSDRGLFCNQTMCVSGSPRMAENVGNVSLKALSLDGTVVSGKLIKHDCVDAWSRHVEVRVGWGWTAAAESSWTGLRVRSSLSLNIKNAF